VNFYEWHLVEIFSGVEFGISYRNLAIGSVVLVMVGLRRKADLSLHSTCGQVRFDARQPHLRRRLQSVRFDPPVGLFWFSLVSFGSVWFDRTEPTGGLTAGPSPSPSTYFQRPGYGMQFQTDLPILYPRVE